MDILRCTIVNTGYQTLNKEIFGEDKAIELLNPNIRFSDGNNKKQINYEAFTIYNSVISIIELYCG